MKNSAEREIFEISKNKKPFEKGDILIYISLLFAIVFLFLFLVIIPKKNEGAGFKVFYKDELVVSVGYGTPPQISSGWENMVEYNQSQNTLTVYFNQDKSDFNRLYINAKEKWIKMQESTCSPSKDCVHSPQISSSGMIYCAPHQLKIVPNVNGGKAPPTVG